MTEYGQAPKSLGRFVMEPAEMMFYLYLPIKLPMQGWAIPKRLKRYSSMIEAAAEDFGFSRIENVYITAKTMFVSPEAPGNRPGFHVDGFGSNGDINYVWSDMNPTEFAVQKFGEISDDDAQSMRDLTAQVDVASLKSWPDCTLLRLDEGVVHRVSPNAERGVRSFVKITFSNHQFRNAGNSINYNLNYSWVMKPRSLQRNIDHG